MPEALIRAIHLSLANPRHYHCQENMVSSMKRHNKFAAFLTFFLKDNYLETKKRGDFWAHSEVNSTGCIVWFQFVDPNPGSYFLCPDAASQKES